MNLETLTASIALHGFWKQFSLAATSGISALEVFLRDGLYKSTFYLLTYLHTSHTATVHPSPWYELSNRNFTLIDWLSKCKCPTRHKQLILGSLFPGNVLASTEEKRWKTRRSKIQNWYYYYYHYHYHYHYYHYYYHYYYYHYYNCFTAPWTLSGTTQVSWYQKSKTRKVKPIWIYWREWVVVASSGPYVNLHLAQVRQPCQNPTSQFLQAGCPSCRPTNSVKALKE